jgi:hypothetical protein
MQEKMDASLKKIRASQEHLNEEMLAKLETKTDANQEKMDAWIVEIRVWQTETMACQEAMHACLENKEPTSLESVTVHEEVPEEEAAVQPVRALKQQHGDQHLAIGCSRKPKKRTQGNGGSQRKLATAGRGMIHHAGVALCKGRGHTGQLVEQRQQKKQTRENLQGEPQKDGCSGRDIGRNQEVPLE